MQITEPEFLVLDELIESLINDNVILLKFLLYEIHQELWISRGK